MTNIIFLGLLLIAGSGCFMIYTDLQETKSELANYKSIDQLNKRSEKFIQDFVKGQYKKYLTGDELSKFEEGGESQNQPSEEVNLIEDVQIKQLNTKFEDKKKTKAVSYATVMVSYQTDEANNDASKYFQTLTLKSNWIKDSKEWKVNKLEVSLLEDSHDEMLRNQAEEAQEKAQ